MDAVSRPKESKTGPWLPESGSAGCQGHVREGSHITPGRSDMSSHFVFGVAMVENTIYAAWEAAFARVDDTRCLHSVFGLWGQTKSSHPSPPWSLSTKHFGFLIAYLSRPKIPPHRPTRVDLWVCQGHVRESSHITPGRSDMWSHFVFCRGNGWKHFGSLASALMKHAAYSILNTQPVKHEGKSVLVSVAHSTTFVKCACVRNGSRIDWSWSNLWGTKRRNNRNTFEDLALDGVANLTAVRLRSCFARNWLQVLGTRHNDVHTPTLSYNRTLYDAWEAAFARVDDTRCLHSVFGLWGQTKSSHPSPPWSLSTKHFGFLIAYLSRPKIPPHRPTRVDLWVCQGHVRESSHITPGRSDMSSHFVFCRGNGWKHFGSLASALMKHAAYSILNTQPVKHEGKSVLVSVAHSTTFVKCACARSGSRLDWSWSNYFSKVLRNETQECIRISASCQLVCSSLGMRVTTNPNFKSFYCYDGCLHRGRPLKLDQRMPNEAASVRIFFLLVTSHYSIAAGKLRTQM